MTTQKQAGPERKVQHQSKPNLGQEDAKDKQDIAEGMSESGRKEAKESRQQK